MATRFNVVYQGKLRPAADEGRFIEEFSQRFGVTAVQARKLIRAGKKVTIKKALPEPQAEKLRTQLESLGMMIELQPVEGDFPEAAPDAPESGETCPKCGSHRVADDSCLDCGIIVSKYRQRQAAEGADPYAAPQSDLMDEHEAGDMTGPVKLPAGAGWAWIVGGFRLFMKNPGVWIGVLLIWFVIAIVGSLIPLVGALAVSIFTPAIIGGLMMGAAEQDSGGDLEINHLFAAFSGNWGQLALVGLLYLVGAILIGVVMAMVVGGALFGMMGMQGAQQMGPEQAEVMMQSMAPTIIIGVLLAVGLSVPLAMAYWFAPALVALDELSAVAAMKLSFMGCLKNIWPFLIYGIVLFGLMIVAAIPFGLGLLVLFPVMMASMYVGYRQVFYGDEV